jgi:hypothetical protein
MNGRTITRPQTRRKLHFGVPAIIVPDEASNKPDYDHLPGVDDPLGAREQRRHTAGGQDQQQHSSHASSMGVLPDLCQAAPLLK